MVDKEKQLLERLEFAVQSSNKRCVFSTSLAWEDQVITHVIFKYDLKINVFTLDTGRLFPETYSTLQATLRKYKKPIDVFFPKHDSIEELVSTKGPFSFYESVDNRKECCFIRKVEPLNRALEGAGVWITGLRAEQSENRNSTGLIETDTSRNLTKIQPLFDWTLDEIKSFITENSIPKNALQDKGFPSIGCQPCTRAISENEPIRAGRWWWEDSSKKECGLHR
ncbi:MAG: phosphoadenylyl-sulfate reductase [Fluviicola sp.]